MGKADTFVSKHKKKGEKTSTAINNKVNKACLKTTEASVDV